jgi:hypothetical protein
MIEASADSFFPSRYREIYIGIPLLGLGPFQDKGKLRGRWGSGCGPGYVTVTGSMTKRRGEIRHGEKD